MLTINKFVIFFFFFEKGVKLWWSPHVKAVDWKTRMLTLDLPAVQWPCPVHDLSFLTCKMAGVGMVSETPTIHSFKESYLWEAQAPEAHSVAGSLSKDSTTEDDGRLSDAISRPWLLDAMPSLWLSCNLRKLDLLTTSLPLLALHCSSTEPMMHWVLAGRQVCTLSILWPSKLFPCLLYESASHPSAGD